MKKLIATRIFYSFLFDTFTIKTGERSYEGHMEYVDNKFILEYYSEKYIIEFKTYKVAKEWLKCIIERYYFSKKELSLDYKKLNNDLPFLSLQILSVKPNEYLIKVKTTKDIINFDINNYYIAHMENDLRRIKLFYPIGEAEKLKAKKEEVLDKYETLCKEIINF